MHREECLNGQRNSSKRALHFHEHVGHIQFLCLFKESRGHKTHENITKKNVERQNAFFVQYISMSIGKNNKYYLCCVCALRYGLKLLPIFKVAYYLFNEMPKVLFEYNFYI